MGAADTYVGPYSARLTTLYVLLVCHSQGRTHAKNNTNSLPTTIRASQLLDASINATADATDRPYTSTDTILVLIAQLCVRVGCFMTTVGMLASARSWQDEFLVQYCGVFSVSLVGLILCLFLRVYRVTLASYPSRFPTVLDYWASFEYCSLLLGHTLLSLLFYYYSITSAFRMGAARQNVAVDPGGVSGRTPTIAAAVQKASSRRLS